MKILTLNMGHRLAGLSRIKQFINEASVDLALIQEGPQIFGFDGLRWISRGYEVETCIMHGSWWWGWRLGVLSQLSILHHETADLGYPDKGDWHRQTQGVCLDGPDGGIKAVNVHLGHSQHERQIEDTLEFLRRLPVRYPALEIIAGDFNLPSQAQALNILGNEGFVCAGWDQVDYIWIRGKPKPEYWRVVLADASDCHRGVMVDV